MRKEAIPVYLLLPDRGGLCTVFFIPLGGLSIPAQTALFAFTGPHFQNCTQGFIHVTDSYMPAERL